MQKPLIVVTNSDMPFLEMMKELLEEEGYAAAVVPDSDSAFDLIREYNPNLVIIELLITDPERGLMVLNKMRLHPETVDIPVIIASTVTQLIRDNEEHLRDKGCDILMKPFTLDELLTIVKKHIPAP